MRAINKEEVLAGLGHVVVLKGGLSVERDISLLSGQAVHDGLRRLGVHVSAIDVDGQVIAALQKTRPDLVFNLLHGAGGEDGVMQGLLETMNLPYTGSGVLASALAMNKVMSKRVWQQAGLGTADFTNLHGDSDWQGIVRRFGKVVVKPVNGGSSLGIATAGDAETLQEKYREATRFDRNVMAERWIEGREFSTGVLGDQVFPTVQLETDREFFDYEAKYVDQATRILCPADLDRVRLAELEKLVQDAYHSLGCSGLARVDVMQDENGDFQLMELNTIPGMTGHSFVPAAARHIGIDFDELLLHVLAEELRNKRQAAHGPL